MGSKVIDVPNVGSVEFPDSMSDDQISTAIKGTYFSGKSKGYTPQPGDASMSAAPTGAKAWLSNLETDFRQGTTNTLPGKILSAMGAQGVDRGAQAGTVDSNLMTPVLGPIHAAQGIAETPDHPVRGPLKAIGGALETMTLPASFMAPEANMGLDNIPSRDYAGKILGQVKEAIGDVPVNTSNVLKVAQEAKALQAAGHGPLPPPIRTFLQKYGKNIYPMAEEQVLPFAEARDRYTAASGKLSEDTLSKLTPMMRAKLAEFTSELGGNIQEVANSAGYGDRFAGAMKEFRRASQIVSGAKTVAKYALGGTAAGGAYYGASQLAKAISRGRP